MSLVLCGIFPIIQPLRIFLSGSTLAWKLSCDFRQLIAAVWPCSGCLVSLTYAILPFLLVITLLMVDRAILANMCRLLRGLLWICTTVNKIRIWPCELRTRTPQTHVCRWQTHVCSSYFTLHLFYYLISECFLIPFLTWIKLFLRVASLENLWLKYECLRNRLLQIPALLQVAAYIFKTFS